ncbi:DUF2807 domain-containing protein [Vicingus serpentipes]|uniref:DUF2807 domain-containing protein n=1 Tax=Vicingus serpentipes TaxID=1926625 RepID=A0A5C6RU65_9FLAO|nr:head GIN domain-containing protein [Vicingus serpentipes]TXB65505.1 DUF2807 domain-containing protein [Vicingus serpentipes]
MIYKNKIVKYLIAIIYICLLNSCDKDSACIKGAGNIVTEDRTTSEYFDKIFLNHNINLQIIQDSNISIVAVGGENLLSRIITKVEDGTLKISSENKCSFLRDYDNLITVYLSVPNIKNIEYIGFGDVTSNGILDFPELTIDSREGTGKINLELNSKNLYLKQHTGPVDFNISGFTKFLYVYTNGNGWVYCQDIVSEKVHVSSNGTGDVFVNPLDELRIELRSIGNVNYFGNPLLNITDQSGSGEIIKK